MAQIVDRLNGLSNQTLKVTNDTMSMSRRIKPMIASATANIEETELDTHTEGEDSFFKISESSFEDMESRIPSLELSTSQHSHFNEGARKSALDSVGPSLAQFNSLMKAIGSQMEYEHEELMQRLRL